MTGRTWWCVNSVTLSTIVDIIVYLRIFRPQRIFCEHVRALIYQTEVVYQQHGTQRTTHLNDKVSQNIVHLCQLSGMSAGCPSSNILFVAEIAMLHFNDRCVFCDKFRPVCVLILVITC